MPNLLDHCNSWLNSGQIPNSSFFITSRPRKLMHLSSTQRFTPLELELLKPFLFPEFRILPLHSDSTSENSKFHPPLANSPDYIHHYSSQILRIGELQLRLKSLRYPDIPKIELRLQSNGDYLSKLSAFESKLNSTYLSNLIKATRFPRLIYGYCAIMGLFHTRWVSQLLESLSPLLLKKSKSPDNTKSSNLLDTLFKTFELPESILINCPSFPPNIGSKPDPQSPHNPNDKWNLLNFTFFQCLQHHDLMDLFPLFSISFDKRSLLKRMIDFYTETTDLMLTDLDISSQNKTSTPYSKPTIYIPESQLPLEYLTIIPRVTVFEAELFPIDVLHQFQLLFRHSFILYTTLWYTSKTLSTLSLKHPAFPLLNFMVRTFFVIYSTLIQHGIHSRLSAFISAWNDPSTFSVPHHLTMSHELQSELPQQTIPTSLDIPKLQSLTTYFSDEFDNTPTDIEEIWVEMGAHPVLFDNSKLEPFPPDLDSIFAWLSSDFHPDTSFDTENPDSNIISLKHTTSSKEIFITSDFYFKHDDSFVRTPVPPDISSFQSNFSQVLMDCQRWSGFYLPSLVIKITQLRGYAMSLCSLIETLQDSFSDSLIINLQNHFVRTLTKLQKELSAQSQMKTGECFIPIANLLYFLIRKKS